MYYEWLMMYETDLVVWGFHISTTLPKKDILTKLLFYGEKKTIHKNWLNI